MLTRRSLGPHPARIRVGRLPAAYKELLTGAHPADNEEQLAGPQAPRYARQPTKKEEAHPQGWAPQSRPHKGRLLIKTLPPDDWLQRKLNRPPSVKGDRPKII